jgi:hypothetical protein
MLSYNANRSLFGGIARCTHRSLLGGTFEILNTQRGKASIFFKLKALGGIVTRIARLKGIYLLLPIRIQQLLGILTSQRKNSYKMASCYCTT